MAKKLVKVTDEYTGKSYTGFISEVNKFKRNLEKCFPNMCTFTEEDAGFTIVHTPDFILEYNNSSEAATMNHFEYGIYRLTNIIKQRKRSLITTKEYNRYIYLISKQLFRF